MVNSSIFLYLDTTIMNKNDQLTAYLASDPFNHLKQQQREASVEEPQIEKNVSLFNKPNEQAFNCQKLRLLKNSYFWNQRSRRDLQTLSNLNQRWNTIYTQRSPNIHTQQKRTLIQISKELSYCPTSSKNKSLYQCCNINPSHDQFERDNTEPLLAKEAIVNNINRFSSFWDKTFNK